MPFFTVQEAISVAGEEVAISELLLENWCEGRDELRSRQFLFSLMGLSILFIPKCVTLLLFIYLLKSNIVSIV